MKASHRKCIRVDATGLILIAGIALFVSSCSSDGDNTAQSDQVFAATDTLQATIRRTTNGVPHIDAATLEEVAFGFGYTQAQDNVCQLAESFVKARSERALYFGPGEENAHIISDFSYLALRLMSGAETDIKKLNPDSRAMLNGFAAGYNQYVNTTDPQTLPVQCRNQPWVKPISAIDLQAHYRLMAMYASGDQFADGALFAAVPPGVSMEPQVVSVPESSDESALINRASESEWPWVDIENQVQVAASDMKDYRAIGSASNAWGIGSQLSESGRGALLANPHFPYTGARRLYQGHLRVADTLDFNGAGLLGATIPLIGFNQNIAWSHTVSTSLRFTAYELTLQPDNPLVYIKDGEPREISVETFRIQVANGTDTPTVLERNFYFSEYGPMLPGDLLSGGALPTWGDEDRAYTYRDANGGFVAFVDTWLQMARATSLNEFQQVFRDCGSTLWVNTVYVDDQGNAYYIDSSSVPNLSAEALAVVEQKRQASLQYDAFFRNGFVLLDGSTSRDDWLEGDCEGLVPFEQKPQLLRQDFVQNANDSYGSTNPASPLSGYSALYGGEAEELSARSRMSLSMLQQPTETGWAAQSPAGQDGRFSARDLIDTIYNNRAYYAETLLAELRSRCSLIGSVGVNSLDGNERDVADACTALQGWNGVFDTDSVGAHVFRVFMAQYLRVIDQDLTVAFDPADPVNTPSTPDSQLRGTPDDAMLASLASAADILESASVPYTATFGAVQRFQRSGDALPGGTAILQANALPWHGTLGFTEGGFNAVNVVTSTVHEDTLFPRLSSPTISGAARLSSVPGEYWQIGRGTSFHFGLAFNDDGPEAYGLLSYGQSTDSRSPFFNDQAVRYSNKDPRPFLFKESDVAANVLPDGTLELVGQRLGALQGGN